MTIDVNTSRFGTVRIESEDVLCFPGGLLGLGGDHRWILLSDGENEAVAWLQSIDSPKIAIAVVSPRRFAPGYRMRVARKELAPLELDDVGDAEVLLVVGRNEEGLTLNLKAPLVINVARRLGRQVVTNGDLPLRHEIRPGQVALKKIA